MISQLQSDTQIEQSYVQRIIKETVSDYLNMTNDNSNQFDDIHEIIYGAKLSQSNNFKLSFASFLKENKLNKAEIVEEKLLSLLKEAQQLKEPSNDQSLQEQISSLNAQSQVIINGNSVSQNTINIGNKEISKNSSKQTESESVLNLTKSNSSEFKHQRFSKPQPSRYSYSQEAEQILESAKNNFWEYDIERVGCLDNEQDIKEYLSTVTSDFEKLGISISVNQILQNNKTISKQLDIETVESVIIQVFQQQSKVPLYQI